MCGILYYKGKDENIDSAFNKIEHRGPDNSTFVNKQNLFIGTHRLSIINTSEIGNQPLKMKSDDKDVFLICNGQIYNYKSLSIKYNIDLKDIRSDVDIILHLYIKGIKMDVICKELDGDFAFVLIDENEVYVARDCIGVRPLFYGINLDNKIISYASEMKSLENLNEIKEIKVFPPGYLYNKEHFSSYINLDDSNLIIRNTVSKLSTDEIQNIIYNLLKKAVIKRIDESDRPVAFLCSGGLDSSIILCIAKEYLDSKNRKLHAFSIEFQDDRSNSDDAIYCKMLTSLLNVEYTAVKFDINDVKNNLEKVIYQIESYDPNTIRAALPMYLLSKYLKENTKYKVFLSGEGADELYCGYNYFNQAQTKNDIEVETNRLIKNIHMFDVLRADRCFSSQGLEIRVPFLDKDFVRFSLGIDGLLRGFKKYTEKYLLRETFRKNYPELTTSRIIDRQKERMSDGCGFSYVPQLLNYCTYLKNDKNNSYNLEKKEQYEKEYYKKIFDLYYRHEDIIIKRELPKWSIQNNKSSNLLIN